MAVCWLTGGWCVFMSLRMPVGQLEWLNVLKTVHLWCFVWYWHLIDTDLKSPFVFALLLSLPCAGPEPPSRSRSNSQRVGFTHLKLTSVDVCDEPVRLQAQGVPIMVWPNEEATDQQQQHSTPRTWTGHLARVSRTQSFSDFNYFILIQVEFTLILISMCNNNVGYYCSLCVRLIL